MRDALRHTTLLSCRAALVLFLLVSVLCSANNDTASTTDVPPTPVDNDTPNKGSPVAFQAEISKMLDILINSLYTKRAVFLRELISNGSDALDKIRVLYLTHPRESLNDMGEVPNMSITITVNTSSNQITVRDGGIGMSKQDLMEHLGSLGASGTKRFLERLQQLQASGGGAADMTSSNKLIGQFGVGFYSAFLVADRVRVASKSDDSDTQYVWESTGDGQYFLYPDPRGNTLGRGTEVVLDIKADAREFIDAETIKSTVHQYSEFIDFPIYLEEMVPVPSNSNTAVKETGNVSADGGLAERLLRKITGDMPEFQKTANKTAEDGNETDEDTTVSESDTTVSESDTTVSESDTTVSESNTTSVEAYEVHRSLINENRPIWTRPASELTDEDYNNFYKSFSNDHENTLYYSHFHVEGEIEMDSILFIPSHIKDNAFMDASENLHNIKLYVRRVFITDDFHDLLPVYLNFVKGIIDSNDLPLNVSREVLQESRILRVIKKKLVRKALSMFSSIAERDEEILAEQRKKAEQKRQNSTDATVSGNGEVDGDDGTNESSEAVDTDVNEDEEEGGKHTPRTGTKHLTKVTYPLFWNLFGKHIRRGVVEDASNRGRLANLLRYYSSRNTTELTSLQAYVDRMPENQRGIFYLTGESIAALENSLMLEDARELGVEVLYMTDAIDEFVITHMTTFQGKRMINLADDSGSLLEETAVSRALYTKRRERYLVFLRWLRELFGRSNVNRVLLTKRSTREAFLVSHQASQVSARLAKILRDQALNVNSNLPNASRVLEVNYRHPLVDELYHRVKANPQDEVAQDMAWVLYDTANLHAEFPLSDLVNYTRRINRLLRSSVDIDADAGLLPVDDASYTTTSEEQEEAQKFIDKRNQGMVFVEDDMLDAAPASTDASDSNASLGETVEEEEEEHKTEEADTEDAHVEEEEQQHQADEPDNTEAYTNFDDSGDL